MPTIFYIVTTSLQDTHRLGRLIRLRTADLDTFIDNARITPERSATSTPPQPTPTPTTHPGPSR